MLEQLLLATSIAQKRPVLSLCPDAIKKEIARRFWLEVADYKLLSPAFSATATARLVGHTFWLSLGRHNRISDVREIASLSAELQPNPLLV